MGWILDGLGLVFKAIWSVRWLIAFVVWSAVVFWVAKTWGEWRADDRWRKVVIAWIKEKKLDQDARRSLRQAGLGHSNISASIATTSGAMEHQTLTDIATGCVGDV